METKDYLALGLSGTAILISVAAAMFTYWQYDLNFKRDQRDKERELEDKTPLVSYSINREPGRRFNVVFSITNRNQYEAELVKVEIVRPQQYQLQQVFDPEPSPTTTASTLHPRPPSKFLSINAPRVKPEMRFNTNALAVNERSSLAVIVDVPDAMPLTADDYAEFVFTFRIRDTKKTAIPVKFDMYFLR
ncbi:hypothetical protein AB8A20_07940 [Tardiphaga sp. 604_B6_N1_1]|uniref:hypothetical protein n=1 Tax=unclassified Tardiphaga TaxID=2631404 RepID=UPI003F28ACB4